LIEGTREISLAYKLLSHEVQLRGYRGRNVPAIARSEETWQPRRARELLEEQLANQ